LRAKGRIQIDWERFYSYIPEVKGSEFQAEVKRNIGDNPSGFMGDIDTQFLYALVRYFKPMVLLESGSGQGKSSAFILKALAVNAEEDAKYSRSILIGVESNKWLEIGRVIPKEVKDRFVPINSTIQKFTEGPDFTGYKWDFFLHDSIHRYNHQMWEFNTMWPLLKAGGVLCSHDTMYNTSFLEFVQKRYAMDEKGLTDFEKSEFGVWANFGNFGFVTKRPE